MKQRPLRIGITGGIGTGKTTVCKIFETLGIPVYYSDDRAKSLMVNNLRLKSKIQEVFGKSSFLLDGSINRAYLASVVFDDQEKLKRLNEIVHPAVFEDVNKWHQAQSGVPYTLQEAALLVETGNYRFLDFLIVVTAPEELRIRRVMMRDGVSANTVKARMAKQLPELAKIQCSDFVIYNDGIQMLVPQVMEIHRVILKSLNRRDAKKIS